MLGVHFDAYTGESFYNDKMAAVVEELEQKIADSSLYIKSLYKDKVKGIVSEK